ncbi:protein of unknown function DUF1064 [[Leptolyngbya] sp. PCC 7376]|uniref:DUF1064 domain-containing protein n=1 Tax=[Leptolyngbya] sp. PCC 7376 TaxID=111781 RepID=UPI00029F2DD5|nr:protein of unknown function DUF1064 [[Leptolyngbya] sp. PCC 7376]
MAKPTKSYRGAKKFVHVDGIRFDSLLEAETYRKLKKVCPFCQIDTQFKLVAKPKTRVFPVMYWKVDFRLSHPCLETPIYVEPKAVLTKDFMIKLKFFEYNDPESFSNLWFVVPDNFNQERITKFQCRTKSKVVRLKNLHTICPKV